MNEFESEARQIKEIVRFEDYVEISIQEEKLQKFGMQPLGTSQRKRNALDIISAVLMLFVIASAFITWSLFVILRKGFEPWIITTGFCLVPIAVNMLMASWDVFKGKPFDSLHIPENARWVKVIRQFLMAVATVALFAYLANLLPESYWAIAIFAWFLFSNCASIFYRLERSLSDSRDSARENENPHQVEDSRTGM